MKAQQKAGVAPTVKVDKDITKDARAAQSNDLPASKPSQKLSYKHKFRLEKLPAEMEALRAAIVTAEAVLADADLYARNPKKFDAAAQKLEQARSGLAAAEDEWLELEILRENQAT